MAKPMPGREDRIYQEAASLWCALYGEPPPQADGATILAMITNKLPDADYQRLASPHMRPTTVVYPKRD